MKKDVGKILLIGYLSILVILSGIYIIGVRPRIPVVWGPDYPQKMAGHIIFCFLGTHYFLFGYLLSEKKHYAARVGNQDKEKTRRWMGLAALCQLGAFGVYAVLWLGYTRTRYIPIDIPMEYLSRHYLEKEKFWRHILPQKYFQDEFLLEEVIHNCTWVISSLVVLIPIILYLITYLTHFLIRWSQYRKRGCVSIGWKRWNLIYIACVGIILFWACDSQMFFPVLEKIPILRQLVPLLMPEGWVLY